VNHLLQEVIRRKKEKGENKKGIKGTDESELENKR